MNANKKFSFSLTQYFLFAGNLVILFIGVLVLSGKHLHPVVVGFTLVGTGILLAVFRVRNAAEAEEGIRNRIFDFQQSEIGLRQKTALQNAILNSANYAIISTTVDGRILTVNDPVGRWLGYEKKELLGRPLIKTIHDIKEIEQETRRLFREEKKKIQSGFELFLAKTAAGQIYEHNWTYVGKEGIRIPVRVSVSAMLNEEGKTAGFVCVAQDISEQAKAQRALADNEERLRKIINLVPDMIYVKDREDRFLLINDAAAGMYGLTAKEITGKRHSEIHPDKEQADKILQDDIRIIDSGEAKFIPIEILTDSAGNRRFLQTNKMPFRESEDSVGVLGVSVDITERIQIEEDVRRSREETQSILDSVPSWIIYKDTENNIIRANQALADAMGCGVGDIEGKNLKEIFPQHAERMFEADLEVMRSGRARLGTIETYQLASGEVWMQTDRIPISDDTDIVSRVLLVSTNITERKRAEEKLRELMETKSRFTSMVSHELRTPLTSIREGINIVYDGAAGRLNDEQKNFLTMTKRNVDRLSRLIDDILDIQKLEAGRMDFIMEPNDFNEIVEEVYKTMSPLTEQRGIEFFLALQRDLPQGFFDKDRIVQVCCVPPLPGIIPRVTSGCPNFALSEAIRIWQAMANSQPPPNAKPLIAAMIGLGKFST